MVNVFQDFQRLGDNGMAFLALDMRDKANAARIVLVARS
jgi:hypothetical protein